MVVPFPKFTRARTEDGRQIPPKNKVSNVMKTSLHKYALN